MKKILAIFLAATMMFLLMACSNQIPADETNKNNVSQPEQTTNEDVEKPSESVGEIGDPSFSVDLDGITTLDELEVRIEEQLANAIHSLKARWEALSAEIDTYEKHVADTDKVTEYYQTVVTETEQMCIMLYEYSAAYARMILDSDMSADEKYDAIDGINDCLYEDACDEINDEIYEGLLDDMNDYFYEGILDDAQDHVDYSDWYDVCSNEYRQWYDTSSDVYDLYYDAASKIYSFYYDMAGNLYERDYERAEKLYVRFLEKIARAKNPETGKLNANAVFDTSLRTAGSIEELETVVDAHVSECVQALYAEWKALSTEVDTFEKYMDHVDAVEEFHAHIENASSQILVMICDYGAIYADLILQSGSSTKDMYRDFEDFKDCIYEDACEIVKEEIYDDLLSEIKKYYYKGIINDAKDSLKYSDWSDAHGDAYSWWSDARTEIYSDWSDTRGDLYSFYSDIRGELYSGDLDGANKELQDFRDKYSGGAANTDAVSANTNAASANSGNNAGEENDEKEGGGQESSSDGIRPEFKEAMDSYEAFYTEYCTFMKEYSENPTDISLLGKYADMLAKAEEMNEAFEAWDEGGLSNEEMEYYLDVNNRVMKMLVDVM